MAGDDARRSDERDRRTLYRLLVILVAFGLLLWFGFANSQRVNVDFLLTDRDVRLVYALAVAAVLGVVIGWFAHRSRD
jgi:uncharacterized integral membrane protein